jgi:hypothetical protein
MSETKVTIRQLLHDANLVFTNTQGDEDVRHLLAVVGVDDDYLERGRSLDDTLKRQVRQFQRAWGEVVGARERVKEVREAALAIYKRDLALARVAVEAGSDAAARLGLAGARKWENHGAWTGAARAMYRALRGDAALRAAVAPFPIDPEAGLAAIDALDAAIADRHTKRLRAQDATAARNATARALRRYLSDFYVVAKIAFTDDPQQLEKLGRVAPS